MSRLSLAALAVAFWTAALIALAWGAHVAISEALTPQESPRNGADVRRADGLKMLFHAEGNTL